MESVRNLFGIRSFWVLVFYNCILGMSFWLINAWLPTFLKEHFHLKLGEARYFGNRNLFRLPHLLEYWLEEYWLTDGHEPIREGGF